MREFRFRAWNGNRFLNSDEFAVLPNGELLVYDYALKKWTDAMHLNIVLMQYTGALDKKGKEIYEGDIVNCSEYGCYGKIYWDEELFSFMFATLCEDGTLFYERFYDYVDDMEIIGNIYEHPELLQEV